MQDGARKRENKRVFAVVAAAAVLVIGGLVIGAQRRSGGTASPFVEATATPAASDAAKAEAVALLDAAAQKLAEGQPAAALELSDQALGKWPQYDAAQRFAATAGPQATAGAQRVQLGATAAAQAALVQTQAGAAARRAYGASAGRSLQRYADALGVFRDRSRQASERPELVRDAEWRVRTAAALVVMQGAADELTGLRPLPQDMAGSAALFAQLASETTQLRQDYARGLSDAEATSAPLLGARTDRATDLMRQANVELRRTGPDPTAVP
jgi:hypothetical protein